MTHESTQAIIQQIEDLLERERDALLSGDLEAIGEFANEKDGLIDSLNKFKDRADLGVLQEQVRRNQALLDGALEGIRKVSARISEFRKVRKTLETYDAGGRKRTINGEVAHQVEKRA